MRLGTETRLMLQVIREKMQTAMAKKRREGNGFFGNDYLRGWQACYDEWSKIVSEVHRELDV